MATDNNKLAELYVDVPGVFAYAVELFFGETPTIVAEPLLNSMKRYCGAAELDLSGKSGGSLEFVFDNFRAKYQNNEIPVRFIIAMGNSDSGFVFPTSSVEQTRSWKQGIQVLQRCKTSIFASDFMAASLPRDMRLALLTGCLQALLENVDCLAIDWKPSQQLVDPEVFEPRQGSPLLDDRFWAYVNVRLFRRLPGEDIIMDTIGLAPFGLPDIQCHFEGLNPLDVDARLRGGALYLFQKSNGIKDGDTIDGIYPGTRWKCRNEMSLVKPKRWVIDVSPEDVRGAVWDEPKSGA